MSVLKGGQSLNLNTTLNSPTPQWFSPLITEAVSLPAHFILSSFSCLSPFLSGVWSLFLQGSLGLLSHSTDELQTSGQWTVIKNHFFQQVHFQSAPLLFFSLGEKQVSTKIPTLFACMLQIYLQYHICNVCIKWRNTESIFFPEGCAASSTEHLIFIWHMKKCKSCTFTYSLKSFHCGSHISHLSVLQDNVWALFSRQWRLTHTSSLRIGT